MMRCAVLAPTPGSVCNCAIDAAFRLTGALGVARAVRAAGAFDFAVAVPAGAGLLPGAALWVCAMAGGTPARAIVMPKKTITNASRRMLSSRIESCGGPRCRIWQSERSGHFVYVP